MPNYNNGKIYKIVDNTDGNIYIGSTIEKLCQRIQRHKSDYKRYLEGKCGKCMSYDIIQNGNFDIVLIESIHCESKEELHKKERYYIELFDCVNKNIPGRTKKEYRTDNKHKLSEISKEYYENNKEQVKAKVNEYRINNEVKIKIKKKEFYQANQQKLLETNKQYRLENKDKIKERKAIKYTCACGSETCLHHKARHERSKKHLLFVSEQNNNNIVSE
jgi:hypothetical protein